MGLPALPRSQRQPPGSVVTRLAGSPLAGRELGNAAFDYA